MVDPPGVVEPPPGAVLGVGAGAGEVAGGVVDGAGVLAPGAGLVAGAGASSFLLRALSATASTDAIIKVLLIIFRLLWMTTLGTPIRGNQQSGYRNAWRQRV